MRLAKAGRHEVGVVKVGQCRVRMIDASGENGFCLRRNAF